MDLPTIANCPIEIEGIDGKTYKLSILSFRELAEYSRWVKFKDYYEAKELGLPKDELQQVYKECKEKKTDFGDKETLAAINSTAGIQKLLYLSLRILQPSLKEEDVSKIINISNFASELTSGLVDILGIGGSNEGN